MKDKLIIIGAGGLGREIAAMVNKYFANAYEFLGFADDAIEKGQQVNGFPVLGSSEFVRNLAGDHSLVVAIASPQRKKEVLRLFEKSNFNFPNLIHPNADLVDSDTIKLGIGNVICDKTILTTNISLGDFNFINLSCTLGHDVVFGDYCSVMPGVHISGGVQLGNEVYIGTGACLINEAAVGAGAVIGAASLVNTDLDGAKTYVGIPAKELNYD